jgi:phage FluMu protein Com
MQGRVATIGNFRENSGIANDKDRIAMPIRFRCAYCNQLMGIASRKAGTVVRCPKCAGEIIVPTPGAESAPAEQQPANPLAFDSANFDVTLNAPTTGSDPAAAPAPLEEPLLVPPPATFEPPRAQRLGLFVPLGMLLLSLAVIVLLLILVFTVGILIGKHAGAA